jgi:hypothetical protein
MKLGKLGAKAKEIVDKRGGTEALKQDAEELKEIAGRKGSLKDKAKAAGEALKRPGAEDKPDAAEKPAAAQAPPPSAQPAQPGQTPDPAQPETPPAAGGAAPPQQG